MVDGFKASASNWITILSNWVKPPKFYLFLVFISSILRVTTSFTATEDAILVMVLPISIIISWQTTSLSASVISTSLLKIVI